jgi:hypothetical protein
MLAEQTQIPAKSWRRPKVVLLTVIAVVAVFVASGRLHRHCRYPYGWSHSCIKGLGLALHNYADANHGMFPRGGKTPEASLSLLAKQGLSFADDPRDTVEILRGKTAPVASVRERLQTGQLLDPVTCGWHYVEGLRQSDNPEIAIAWDKIGLGHNGERSQGAHEVLFVDGSRRMVSVTEWPDFLANQKRFLAARPVTDDDDESTPPPSQ